MVVTFPCVYGTTYSFTVANVCEFTTNRHTKMTSQPSRIFLRLANSLDLIGFTTDMSLSRVMRTRVQEDRCGSRYVNRKWAWHPAWLKLRTSTFPPVRPRIQWRSSPVSSEPVSTSARMLRMKLDGALRKCLLCRMRIDKPLPRTPVKMMMGATIRNTLVEISWELYCFSSSSSISSRNSMKSVVLETLGAIVGPQLESRKGTVLPMVTISMTIVSTQSTATITMVDLYYYIRPILLHSGLKFFLIHGLRLKPRYGHLTLVQSWFHLSAESPFLLSLTSPWVASF